MKILHFRNTSEVTNILWINRKLLLVRVGHPKRSKRDFCCFCWPKLIFSYDTKNYPLLIALRWYDGEIYFFVFMSRWRFPYFWNSEISFYVGASSSRLFFANIYSLLIENILSLLRYISLTFPIETDVLLISYYPVPLYIQKWIIAWHELLR